MTLPARIVQERGEISTTQLLTQLQMPLVVGAAQGLLSIAQAQGIGLCEDGMWRGFDDDDDVYTAIREGRPTAAATRLTEALAGADPTEPLPRP